MSVDTARKGPQCALFITLINFKPTLVIFTSGFEDVEKQTLFKCFK